MLKGHETKVTSMQRMIKGMFMSDSSIKVFLSNKNINIKFYTSRTNAYQYV